MDDTSSSASPLLRLPRELRDQIFSHLFRFEVGNHFPKWPQEIKTKRTLHNALPSICRASRQLFLECTPIFLAPVTINSNDAEDSGKLLNFLMEFPEDRGFKAVQDFNLWEWTEDAIPLQLDLICRFIELEATELIFAMNGTEDGWSKEDYDYNEEQDFWYKTGLHYSPRDGRSVEEEKQKMSKDSQAFVTKYGLDRILALPKLRIIRFQFYDLESDEFYRHRLANPLWRWAEGVMEDKLGEVDTPEYVYTDFSEDYDRIIESC